MTFILSFPCECGINANENVERFSFFSFFFFQYIFHLKKKKNDFLFSPRHVSSRIIVRENFSIKSVKGGKFSTFKSSDIDIDIAVIF